LAVAALKLGITSIAVLALRYPVRMALSVGLGLAQIGEFSLVLEQAGRLEGLTPGGFGEVGQQVFLAVSVLLMAVTPFFGGLEKRLAAEEGLAPRGDDDEDEPLAAPGEGVVIIGGYGVAGRAVQSSSIAAGIPYRIVDLNPVSVTKAQASGVPIELGDLSRRSVLEHAGLSDASCLVLTMNDIEAVTRATKTAKLLRPDLRVVVRAQYAADEKVLTEAGADHVVIGEREAAARLSELVCGRAVA
ncbi:MAG: NAD-binding protein, partial [Gemmatimonadetes bacterium]|nr:NAD-binding protein [Gemmatimonadota bacterium]